MEKIGYILIIIFVLTIIVMIIKRIKGEQNIKLAIKDSSLEDNFFTLHHIYGEIPCEFNKSKNEYILLINNENLIDNKLIVHIPSDKQDEMLKENRNNVLDDYYSFVSTDFENTKRNMLARRKEEIIDWIMDTPLGDGITYQNDTEILDTIFKRTTFHISHVDVDINWHIINIYCHYIIKTDAKPFDKMDVEMTYDLQNEKVVHLKHTILDK